MTDIMEQFNQLTEKELLIYKAVIKNIKSGKNPGDITISEIARTAGIGKGTVYEYFKSKEEILLKTILFQFVRSFNDASKLVQSGKSFEEIFKTMLDNAYYAFDMKSSNFGGTLSLFSCKEKTAEQANYFLTDTRNIVKYFKQCTNSLLQELISVGVSQGVLKRVEDKEFAMFTISASISSFINSTHFFEETESEEYKRVKHNAYRLVIETLG